MKAFAKTHKQSDIRYIECKRKRTLPLLFKRLKANNVHHIHTIELLNHDLEVALDHYTRKHSITLTVIDHPGFLTPSSWIHNFFTTHRFHLTSFYIAQRKRLNVLLKNGTPVGGKWSYDPENRRKLPANIPIPTPWTPPSTTFVDEATKYVLKHFPKNPGQHQDFQYPISHHQAQQTLTDFINNRLHNFGDYQDAISHRNSTLFHSLLSSSLNIGLITPYSIIEQVLHAYNTQALPLNSVEGFIRQIIGWREYIRAVYLLKGKDMVNRNYWCHSHRIPHAFYTANTGIIPLDNVLKRVNQNAYAHHIERLMILGNFCLLTQIHPQKVNQWFMEMFIDSYPWVMVPNVFGMSQYADGGSISTKPYISSSNYLRKMSDYQKGQWNHLWDALFWAFINQNQQRIEQIPRMKVLLHHLRKIAPERLSLHEQIAKTTIDQLYH